MNYFGMFFSFMIPGIIVGLLIALSIVKVREKAYQKSLAGRRAAAKAQRAEDLERFRRSFDLKVGK